MASISAFVTLCNQYWSAAFTLKHWQMITGSTFNVVRPLLTEKGAIAKVTADLDDGGAIRKVVRYPDGTYWLAGDGGLRKRVSEADVQLWCLNKKEVYEALSRALNLHRGTRDAEQRQGVALLGCLTKPGHEPVPVSLVLTTTIASTQRAVQQYLSNIGDAAIVLTLADTVIRDSDIMLAQSKGAVVDEIAKYLTVRGSRLHSNELWQRVPGQLKWAKQRHGRRAQVRTNVMANLERLRKFVKDEFDSRLREHTEALVAERSRPSFPQLNQKTIAKQTRLTETQMTRLLSRTAAYAIKKQIKDMNDPDALDAVARRLLVRAERAQRKSE